MPSKRTIDINQSEYRPLQVNMEEIKKIRKRENIHNFLKSITYLLILLMFSIYALFSDDFRVLVANSTTDAVFFCLTILTFIFFALDIGATLYFKRTYFKSLGFWLDLASTLTILLDIGWIYSGFFQNSKSSSYQSISPAAEASQKYVAASRYMFAMEYIRLLRLNGLIKFISAMEERYFKKIEKKSIYKRSKNPYYSMYEKKDDELTDKEINKIFLDKTKFLVYPSFDFDKNLKTELTKPAVDPGDTRKGEVKSSSRDFSTQNIRRVFYLLLVLIVFIPIFTVDSFFLANTPSNSSLQTSAYRLSHPSLSTNLTDILTTYYNLNTDSLATFVMATIYKKTALGTYEALAQLKNSNVTNATETEYIQSARLTEVLVFVSPDDLTVLASNEMYLLSIFDNSSFVKKNAALGLGRTLFAILNLLISLYFFQNDAEKLLRGPFEEMMIKIKKIEQNPMKAAKETKEEALSLEKAKGADRVKRREQLEKERYETTVLINTLVKSGELLALGFGEAGTEIIIEKLNHSIKRENNKVICIFGFCDIRHFTEVTDELREKIMVFVNEIAEIISTIVDENTGSTNKNIGDCFLLVWKFRQSEIINVFDHDPDGEIRKDIKLKEYADFNNPVTSRCELALLSFLQCIIVVHTSPTLNRYKKDPQLLRRIPGFKVSMGFGLHIGWAIEGAIGSDHKIDASYLSPNVNLASRLQAATKQFGVHILISGEVYNLLSPEIKKLLRIVDVVNLKGSKLAMKLYTYDMYLNDLPIETIPELNEKTKQYLKRIQQKRLLEYRQRIQKIHAQFFNNKISGKTFFFSDDSIITVRKRFKKSFFDIWSEGFNAYISGDWAYARINFNKTKSMIRDYTDGPSNVLLSYMESHDFNAPDDWEGVRHLYSK